HGSAKETPRPGFLGPARQQWLYPVTEKRGHAQGTHGAPLSERPADFALRHQVGDVYAGNLEQKIAAVPVERYLRSKRARRFGECSRESLKRLRKRFGAPAVAIAHALEERNRSGVHPIGRYVPIT